MELKAVLFSILLLFSASVRLLPLFSLTICCSPTLLPPTQFTPFLSHIFSTTYLLFSLFPTDSTLASLLPIFTRILRLFLRHISFFFPSSTKSMLVSPSLCVPEHTLPSIPLPSPHPLPHLPKSFSPFSFPSFPSLLIVCYARYLHSYPPPPPPNTRQLVSYFARPQLFHSCVFTVMFSDVVSSFPLPSLSSSYLLLPSRFDSSLSLLPFIFLLMLYV